MAIIKCPECGHQISDKAPVCPSCGIEIAGKITRCTHCGETIFKNQDTCPNCHARLNSDNGIVPPPIPNAPQQAPLGNVGNTGLANTSDTSHKSHKPIILAFVISLFVCGVCYYFYSSAKTDRCDEAYQIAMASDDPKILQNFLDNYGDASQAQLDSVRTRLDILRQGDAEWMNAVASGSKSVLEDYLSNHPDSPHRGEATHKIDSIDWAAATDANTLEAYKMYMDEHATGEHIDECKENMLTINSKTVQPEEKEAIATLFRHFFQSINSRNEDGLASTVSSFLSSFLGKTDATKSDVITFMHKIYKEDITNMNWRLNNDWKIEKKDVGGNQFEYSVVFTASQDIERTDPNKEKSAKYNIKATVDTDGKISSLNMVKILE